MIYILQKDGRNVGISTTSPPAKLTLKMGYSDGKTGGFCIDSADTNTYNLRVFSYVQAGGQVGYIFQVNYISLTNDNFVLGYDGTVATANYLCAGGFTHRIRINGNDYGNTFY
jgi:hypothetical protein